MARPYIPVTLQETPPTFPYRFERPQNDHTPNNILYENEMSRSKRDVIDESVHASTTVKLDIINVLNETEFQNSKNNSKSHEPNVRFQKRTKKPESKNRYPHFHVTYWMFYPYSQVSSKMHLLFKI